MSIKKTVITILCAAAFLSLSGCDSQDYKTALGMMENQQWSEAREMFVALEDYKDSADMLAECDYNIALGVMENGEYEDAIAKFEALNGYKESADKISECGELILKRDYDNAMALYNDGEYDKAIEAFKALGDYEDSADMITDCTYQNAMKLYESKKYNEALATFEDLGDYEDSYRYTIICKLLIDSDDFTSDFAANICKTYKQVGCTYSLLDINFDDSYTEKIYVIDGEDASEKSTLYFTNTTSDWYFDSYKQINSVYAMGTAESPEEIEKVLVEVIITAGAALAELDGSSPDEVILMLSSEFESLSMAVIEQLATNPEAYLDYDFERNGYDCFIEVSCAENEYTFLFGAVIPELVTE